MATAIKKKTGATANNGFADRSNHDDAADNQALRTILSCLIAAKKGDFAVRLPARVLCTDNAAMIAHAAWRRLSAGGPALSGPCDPALPLRSWA